MATPLYIALLFCPFLLFRFLLSIFHPCLFVILFFFADIFLCGTKEAQREMATDDKGLDEKNGNAGDRLDMYRMGKA